MFRAFFYFNFLFSFPLPSFANVVPDTFVLNKPLASGATQLTKSELISALDASSLDSVSVEDLVTIVDSYLQQAAKLWLAGRPSLVTEVFRERLAHLSSQQLHGGLANLVSNSIHLKGQISWLSEIRKKSEMLFAFGEIGMSSPYPEVRTLAFQYAAKSLDALMTSLENQALTDSTKATFVWDVLNLCFTVYADELPEQQANSHKKDAFHLFLEHLEAVLLKHDSKTNKEYDRKFQDHRSMLTVYGGIASGLLTVGTVALLGDIAPDTLQGWLYSFGASAVLGGAIGFKLTRSAPQKAAITTEVIPKARKECARYFSAQK